MALDDIVLNKISIIERCLKRIKEDYIGFQEEFEKDYMRQDAIFMNLQRACQAAIDLAVRVIRKRHLGVPQTNKEVFALLEKASLLPAALSHHLQAMVGFRNIAVHDYQKINNLIVKNILDNHLQDFSTFIEAMKRASV